MMLPIAAAAALLLAGCGGRDASPETNVEATSRLRSIAMLYNRYQNAHRGRPPANEGEFKKFIEQHGERFLELAKVENVDELFLSARDGQPYVVRYGASAAQGESGIVVYEPTSVEGARYVAYQLGFAEKVDDARFKELMPDPRTEPK